jgi:hypothetical protein
MFVRSFSGLIAGLIMLVPMANGPAAESTVQGPRAVVELFTSQGCSSCPPADALLTSLAERNDVVALAYHVDYWDYIGWEDTFGDKAYSDRQRDYAKSWGSSRIFTPQMVINGGKGVIGSKRHEVQRSIEAAQLPLTVGIQQRDGMLSISVPADAQQFDATIWLVTYIDRADVSIDSGDNAGRTVGYTHVVTGRQVLGMWEADTGAHLKLPLAEIMTESTSGVAVVVQQERNDLPGPIIGAAAYEL